MRSEWAAAFSEAVWTVCAVVTNAGCRATPQEEDAPVVVDVVVPAAVAEQVVAEAEVVCAAAAVVEEAAARFTAEVARVYAVSRGW